MDKEVKKLWNKYIELSKKDSELLKQEYSVSSFNEKYKEYHRLTNENLEECNEIGRQLRELIKPRQKNCNFKLAKIPVIKKIYKWYRRIHGHTYKYSGPIVITKDGITEYPNTRYYRIIKLNCLIR